MKHKKIYICGPSGVGKTTLARYIESRYNIPFISTSGKVLWREYGISSHKELLDRSTSDHKFAVNYQFELLKHRTESLRGKESFVTDRSPIDNLVYFMLEASKNASLMESADYVNQCRSALIGGDLLINIKFNEEIQIEDDGARIINPLFQYAVEGIFDKVFKEQLLDDKYVIDKMEIDYWDWETRKKYVHKAIMGKTGFWSVFGL